MNKKMSIEAIENGIIHVLNQYPTIELVEAAGKYLGKGLMLEKKEEIVAVTVIVYGGAVSRKLIQYAEPLYEFREELKEAKKYEEDELPYDNDYTLGLVVCHNGSIFMYAASEAINSDYYNLVVADYIKDGYNDYETQIKAINELQKNFDIIFKEVVAL
ncbi:MAG: hypothetical protein Q4E51_09660 [Lachnospiraceae bacterium]|nr:hypothetical protein [Lachnospiraceae bacterium]MDO4966956.1 hypothetical protein [Lachnospiraceae bacterium]